MTFTLSNDTKTNSSVLSNVIEDKRDIIQKEPTPKLIVTWQGYDVTIRTLAKEILKSEWEFDKIVCIARGGMFVGDALSRIFKKKLAVIFTSSYREENGTQQNKLIISKNIAMTTDTLGKRVLLVDDLVDSGITIEAVKRRIKEDYKEVDEVRTAVLWYKTGSKFIPEYFADKVEKEAWIEQPFEQYDNIEQKDL